MQTLNLYQTQFQPDRRPLRPWQMLGALLIGCVLLVLFSMHYAWQTGKEKNLLLERKQQLASLQAERDRLHQAGTQMDTQNLDQRIQEAETTLAYRRELRNRMAEQSAEQAPVLSEQLTALARFSNADFSLESFSLTDSGRYVQMQGLTRSRSALPEYLMQLQQVPAFANSRFGVLQLQEMPAAGPYQFRIGLQEEADFEQ